MNYRQFVAAHGPCGGAMPENNQKTWRCAHHFVHDKIVWCNIDTASCPFKDNETATEKCTDYKPEKEITDEQKNDLYSNVDRNYCCRRDCKNRIRNQH